MKSHIDPLSAAQEDHKKAQEYLKAFDLANAFKCEEKAAEAGLAEAQYSLGQFYLNGIGTPQKHEEAVRWFEEARKQGHGEAIYRLGNCYYEGYGVGDKDPDTAADLYKEAVDKGYIPAKIDHGSLCYLGYGKDAGKEAGIQLLKDAAEQVDKKEDKARAQFNLASVFYMENNPGEAVKWFEKSAENGCTEAMYDLCICYINEIGTEKNEKEALRYLKAAAYDKDKPLSAALCALGNYYMLGELVEKQDYAEAYKCYFDATSLKNPAPEAWRALGICHFNGYWVKQNYEEAATYFEFAIGKGDIPSKYHLGVCYYTGKGKEKSLDKGLELIEEAARDGDHAPAQYTFGEYFEDTGDEETAKDWFLRSAEQGYSPAQYKLGTYHEKGKGGFEANAGQAVEWYTKAAEQDEPDAQYKLGRYYKSKGELEQAKHYLELADYNGNTDARDLLELVEQLEEKNSDKAKTLTPDAKFGMSNEQHQLIIGMMDLTGAIKEDVNTVKRGLYTVAEGLNNNDKNAVQKGITNALGGINRIDESVDRLIGSWDKLTENIDGLREEFESRFDKNDPDDPAITDFIELTCREIKSWLEKDDALCSGLDAAEDDLKTRFGGTWSKLQDDTRTSLISAWTVWKQYKDLTNRPNDPKPRKFDFSGVVICATGALETELRKIMFDDLKTYAAQNISKQRDADFKNKLSLFSRSREFTLGSVVNLFSGEIEFKDNANKKCSFDAPKERTEFQKLLEQYFSGIMNNTIQHNKVRTDDRKKSNNIIFTNISKRTECFTKWVFDNNKEKKNPVGGNGKFFTDEKGKKSPLYCAGSLLAIIEHIRSGFRNPAAHVGNLNHAQAEECCSLIIGSEPAGSTLNQITSVLINFHKLLK